MSKKETKRTKAAKKVKEVKKTEVAVLKSGKQGPEEKGWTKDLAITVDRKILEPQLNVAKDFIERKPSLPILAHVQIKTEKGECRILSTNLETSWTTVIKCSGDKVNRGVPLELLIMEIRALHPEIEQVELKFRESTVSVNGRCEIYTMKGEEFPVRPEVENPLVVTIEGFIQKSRKVIVAAGESDTRYTLNSMFLDLECGYIVATDGHRLHFEDIDVKGKEGKKLIIPRSAAFLAVKHSADSTFAVGEHHIMFKLAGGEMVTRLMDGNYPDYQNVIPKENSIKAVFKASEFLRVLTGAVPVSSDGKGIRLTINGQMDIESMNPGLGSYKWHIPCTSEGISGDFSIGFNANYIIDAIKTYATKEEDVVVMQMSEPLAPCLINDKAVVMPMRI